MPRPSAALVVASIALFVALSGTSYAVTQLPRNSVGTVQLKSGSVTTGKIAKGAVSNVKLADDSVTGAKVKNGSLAVDDLTAAARAELRGTVLATATASANDALATPYQEDTAVLSTTITVSYAARLQIAAAVSMTHIDSGDGTPEWAPFSCFATLNGTRTGKVYFSGAIDGLLVANAFSVLTLPVVASADVEPGTHRVGITCVAGGTGGDGYQAANREINVAAFTR